MLPYAQLGKILLNCLDCFSSKQGFLDSSYTSQAEESEAVLLPTIRIQLCKRGNCEEAIKQVYSI